MLYNICYWRFFLYQGNWWTKYLAHPKTQRPKPCLLMFSSLVTLDSFHLLLSTQLTANLTPEWSGGSMFHPLLYIYAKNPFSFVETVANHTLNRQCAVVFDQLWANTAPTLNTAFWYIQLFCYLTSIYNQLKRVCWVFWCFPGQLTWVFSIILVCTTMFKVSIPPLNHCFQWSRVWIILIKPLLSLNCIFSHQKAMFYQHTKLRFLHYFENSQQ